MQHIEMLQGIIANIVDKVSTLESALQYCHTPMEMAACRQLAAECTIDVVTQPGYITFNIADGEVSAAVNASLHPYNVLDEADSLSGKMLRPRFPRL